MTDREFQASHVFHLFLGRNPDDKECLDMADVGLGWNGYLWLDSRLENGVREAGRQMLLIYTSCHAEQIICFIRNYRPEVLEKYYVNILFTHRLLLHRGRWPLELVHAIFASADAIITNPMNPKFEELSTIPLLKECNPSCKLATFVPPSMACWWPVVRYHGEEPVAAALLKGQTVAEMVEDFKGGRWNALFPQRFEHQMERIKIRERDCNVHISGFIERYMRTHKMFFTGNHPTFQLAGHIANQSLGILGFGVFDDSRLLGAPSNQAGFSNHFPETAYEWDYYKFEYPRQFTSDWGGPDAFYASVIEEAAGAMKDPNYVLNNPVTAVELEP